MLLRLILDDDHDFYYCQYHADSVYGSNAVA